MNMPKSVIRALAAVPVHTASLVLAHIIVAATQWLWNLL